MVQARLRRKLIPITAAVMMAATVAACGGGDDGESGETIRLTLAAGHAAGAMTYTSHSEEFLVPEMVRRVNEETDYTLQIDEQYGGSVAGPEEVLESTRDGIVDLGLVPYQFEPAALMILNFSNYVPFGSPDSEVVLAAGRTVLEEHPDVVAILEEEFNQKPLAHIAVGDYGLATNFPVTGPDDMDGHSLTGAGPNLAWVEPVGVTPVQGHLGEWYNGIQTGLYDGAIIFLDAYLGFNLNEVAPYFTRTGFGSVFAGGLHINMDTWNELPEEVQTIIAEVALEYETTFGDAIDSDEQATLEGLEGTDAEVSEMSEDMRVAWVEQLPNFPEQFIAETEERGLPGDSVMRTYLRALGDEGYDLPRDWLGE